MKKAQVWYVEFVIAIVIVTVMTGIFLQYLSTSNTQGESINRLHTQAVRMSELVISPGVPQDWDQSNVRIAGITNANWRINQTKIEELYAMSEAQQRVSLTAQSNFFMYLHNQTDNISINGQQWIGSLPSDSVQQAVVNRYLIYEGKIVQLRMVVWQ